MEKLTKVTPQEAANIVRKSGYNTTRFVVSSDEPNDPIAIDGTGIYNAHSVIQENACIKNAKGGFCFAKRDGLVYDSENAPRKMEHATQKEFQNAQAKGVVVID